MNDSPGEDGAMTPDVTAPAEQPTLVRHGAGSYTLTLGDREVRIVRVPDVSGPAKWIAAAEWDRYCVTDPEMTLRAARACAEEMLGVSDAG